MAGTSEDGAWQACSGCSRGSLSSTIWSCAATQSTLLSSPLQPGLVAVALNQPNCCPLHLCRFALACYLTDGHPEHSQPFMWVLASHGQACFRWGAPPQQVEAAVQGTTARALHLFGAGAVLHANGGWAVGGWGSMPPPLRLAGCNSSGP